MIVSFIAISTLAIAQLPAIGSPAPSLDIRPYESSAECGASDMQIKVEVTGVKPVGILTVELYKRWSDRNRAPSQSVVYRGAVKVTPLLGHYVTVLTMLLTDGT